ncbi:MAG: TlpA family protein disulfide reductase [Pirellulaceae bacterium]
MTICRPGLLSCLVVLSLVVLSGVAIAADDEKKNTQPKPASETVDRYAVPEGDVRELLKFLDELGRFRPKSREEYVEFRKKGSIAMRQAAEKILSLETDTSSAAYQKARQQILQLEVQSLAEATPEQSKNVLDQVKTYLADKKDLSRNELSIAFMTASTLEQSGSKDLAFDAYNAFGEIFSKSKEKDLAGYGAKMLGSARRMNLLGNEMEIQGTLVDGSEFSWKSYCGKVVLVDFWATWCGPCIAELPNVKKAYDLYHEKGFDVVGISLDTDRQRLEKFLEERELPWVCLYEEGAGWNHPMANYYGVMGIPTVILVDQKGKVVSLQARGPALTRELERLLGPAKEPAAADEPKPAKDAPSAP